MQFLQRIVALECMGTHRVEGQDNPYKSWLCASNISEWRTSMIKTHSCKQYVQETRDHPEQGYDAYTYLEVLEHLSSRGTLRKTNVR